MTLCLNPPSIFVTPPLITQLFPLPRPAKDSGKKANIILKCLTCCPLDQHISDSLTVMVEVDVPHRIGHQLLPVQLDHINKNSAGLSCINWVAKMRNFHYVPIIEPMVILVLNN